MKFRHVFAILAAFIGLLTLTACSGSSGVINGPSGEGTTIAGRILNSQQKPIPYAEIEIYSSENAHKLALAQKTGIKNQAGGLRLSGIGSSFTARTNEAGEFTLSGVPAGEYTLQAHLGPGQQFLQRGLRTSEVRGGMITLDAVLTPTGSASGLVKHAGNPVKGAVVYLEGTKFVAITDGAGEYSLANVPVAATPYLLRVLDMPYGNHGERTLGLATPQAVSIEKGANTDLAELLLVTQLNSDHQYHINGSLTGGDISGGLDRRIVAAFNQASLDNPAAQIYFAMTDSDGNYSIRTNETGEYIISVILENNEFLTPSTQAVTLATSHTSANPATCPAFNLQSGRLVAGTLAQNGDQSAILAHVGLKFTQGAQEYSAFTDELGQFSLHLPDGTYNFLAYDPSYKNPTPSSITVGTDISDLALGLTPDVQVEYHSISGTVQYAHGAYSPSLVLKFVDTSNLSKVYYAPVEKEEEDEFEFQLTLPAGTYQCSVAEGQDLELAFYEHNNEPTPASDGTITLAAPLAPEFGASLALTVRVPSPPVQRLNLAAGARLHGFEVTDEHYHIIYSTASNPEIYVETYHHDSISYSDKGAIGTAQQVSSAVFNNQLFILSKNGSELKLMQYKDSYNRTHYDTSRYFLSGNYSWSLFATELGLYVLRQSATTAEAGQNHWFKVPTNDPNFKIDGTTVEPDKTNGSYFAHVEPCHNDKYIYSAHYVGTTTAGSLHIQANDKYEALSKPQSDNTRTIATIPLPENAYNPTNGAPPSVYLTCEENRLYITLHVNEAYNYFAYVVDNNEEEPQFIVWSNSGFSLAQKQEMYAHRFYPGGLVGLTALPEYNDLQYPTLTYDLAGSAPLRILIDPMKMANSRLFVLAQTGDYEDNQYSVLVFNQMNWPY